MNSLTCNDSEKFPPYPNTFHYQLQLVFLGGFLELHSTVPYLEDMAELDQGHGLITVMKKKIAPKMHEDRQNATEAKQTSDA